MSDQPTAAALKVFISYSRDDMLFADELVAGLAYDGRYDVTIDRHSIIEGEDWKSRLGALIADADTVVFVLSPASAKSDVCAWEVEQADKLSKRILPVLVRSVGSNPVPEKLAALNYVRFDSHEDGRLRSFMAGLSALVGALNVDASWLREHTRYLTLARSWDEAERTVNRLLSGDDIVAAKSWVANHPKDAPQPTELHLDFIRASEEAEAAEVSAERKRLAEIDAAQQARAEALNEAERANAEKEEASRRLVRRNLTLGGVAAALLLAIAGSAALYLFNERMQKNVDQTYISLKLAGSELDYAVAHFQTCAPPLSAEEQSNLKGVVNLDKNGLRGLVDRLGSCSDIVNGLLPDIRNDFKVYREKLSKVPASAWAKALKSEVGPRAILRSPDGRIYHPATSKFYKSVEEFDRSIAN